MNRRLLVVDDEPDMAELFRLSFRREIKAGQFTLRFAQSGAEALAQLGQEGADVVLVLSDINMPGMSGLDMLAEVKRRWPGLPVLMISAYDMGDHRDRAAALGAADFVAKPIDFAELRRRIFDLLGEAA